MPELPEMETLRRDLDREVGGKRIKTTEVPGRTAISHSPISLLSPYGDSGCVGVCSVTRSTSGVPYVAAELEKTRRPTPAAASCQLSELTPSTCPAWSSSGW